MSFKLGLNELLEKLLYEDKPSRIDPKQLIQCLDLTLLNLEASEEALYQIEQDATAHQVAAVCLYPQHLAAFSQGSLRLATVINFPDGKDDLSLCLAQIKNSIELGAQEIDYVFPYQNYIAGETKKALNHSKTISQFCKDKNLSLKVIMESGAFENLELLYQACTETLDIGCDFLKTSTGKIIHGASLAHVCVMLSAIKDHHTPCGIKISGGVKKTQQAVEYARLSELMLDKSINKDWFRIGASTLLQELIEINSK